MGERVHDDYGGVRDGGGGGVSASMLQVMWRFSVILAMVGLGKRTFKLKRCCFWAPSPQGPLPKYSPLIFCVKILMSLKYVFSNEKVCDHVKCVMLLDAVRQAGLQDDNELEKHMLQVL